MLKILILIFSVCLRCSVYAAFVDLSNLDAQIQETVQRSLAPLDNLGSNIRRQLAPLDNLGPEIESSVRANLAPMQADLSNLGPSIQSRVRANLAPMQADLSNLGSQIENKVKANLAPMQADLSNLGAQISQQVEQNLLPVKAMAMRLQMIHGVGGITVVHFTDGKTMLAKEGHLYECSGTINKEGICSGSLSKLNFNKTENYCYVTPNVKVNNYYCFSSGNHIVSVSDINGSVSCTSTDTSPTLLITQDEYQKMCKTSGQPTYTYIADVNNPMRIVIPNKNPYLKCQNNTPNVCIFT